MAHDFQVGDIVILTRCENLEWGEWGTTEEDYENGVNYKISEIMGNEIHILKHEDPDGERDYWMVAPDEIELFVKPKVKAKKVKIPKLWHIISK